ncbi:MAG: hypothetical protein FJX59_15705, partial [Alphaproteobacteria bacterium]|nr:hypothetical protein [Alphaproteobacteria bacterium]
SIDAAPVNRLSLAETLRRIEGATVTQLRPARQSPHRVNPVYPRPLRDYLGEGPEPGEWRQVAGGVEVIDVPIPVDDRRVRILRVQPGQRLPRHGHSGDEVTMVLAGGYRTREAAYRRGDVESADASTIHQPVAEPGEPCICVTVTRGPIIPTVALSRLFQKVSRIWS